MQPIPEDFERAVAVVAHPDDLEYGAASAIARWHAQGKSIAYVLVSSGEAGIDGLDPAECGPLREAEERASAAVVGVSEVEFLGHPDGAIEYGLALRRDLARCFRRLRPEIVLGMNFELTWPGPEGSVNHADHRNVGLALLDACRDAGNRWLFPEDGEPWAGITSAYIFGSSEPTHFVDVSEHIGLGVASLKEHRAYIEGLGRAFDPETFLHTMAEFGGAAAGVELAVLWRRYGVG
jgi:LmbE family N-acetylglucosaminyl deacetylase